MIETVYKEIADKKVSWFNFYEVKALSFSISMLIVLFNKFVLGKVKIYLLSYFIFLIIYIFLFIFRCSILL